MWQQLPCLFSVSPGGNFVFNHLDRLSTHCVWEFVLIPLWRNAVFERTLEICIVACLLMLWLHWGCVHVSTSVIHRAPSDTSSPTHIWVTLQAHQGARAFSILHSGKNTYIFAWLPVNLQLNYPEHTAVIGTEALVVLFIQVVSSYNVSVSQPKSQTSQGFASAASCQTLFLMLCHSYLWMARGALC